MVKNNSVIYPQSTVGWSAMASWGTELQGWVEAFWVEVKGGGCL